MAPAEKVVQSFLYVADKRPVLAFDSENDAEEFQKAFKGAEIYGNKLHVFLPTPHGLDYVRGGKGGETAYVFHFDYQARDWFEKLKGYGTMFTDGDAPDKTIFLGSEGHEYGGEPIWPGVA